MLIEIKNDINVEEYNNLRESVGWDFSKLKCDVIYNSQFNFFNEINSNVTENTILLDIGTGAGEKLTGSISNKCLLKIGTDFSSEMIKHN